MTKITEDEIELYTIEELESPADAQEQALQKVLRIYSPDLLHNNETFHQLLIEKVKVPYQQDGYERSYEVALLVSITQRKALHYLAGGGTYPGAGRRQGPLYQ